MDATIEPSAPELVHLPDIPGAGGVVWSASPGCHVNLVVLDEGTGIGAHRNDEVDVLMVVLDGGATVAIGDREVSARTGDAIVMPRGAVRSVAAGGLGVRYLTVHAERRALDISPRGVRDV